MHTDGIKKKYVCIKVEAHATHTYMAEWQAKFEKKQILPAATYFTVFLLLQSIRRTRYGWG